MTPEPNQALMNRRTDKRLIDEAFYAELAAPRVLHPLMCLGIGHDIAGQLKTLKRILERGPRGIG
jgi:hypothetical protein